MADSEGSVFVEGVDVETEDESTEDVTNEDTEGQGEGSSQQSDDNSDDNQATDDNKSSAPEQNGETKLTEKGTKLDENPLSAAHQQLANAVKQIKQYEEFLGNPEAVARYLEQNGYKKADANGEKPKVEPLLKIDASKLQTVGDLQEAFNGLQTAFLERLGKSEETVANLTKQLQGLSEGRKVEVIQSRTRSDISTIRSKYPELDPKSGEGVYNEELEKDIAELYHSLDFDERTGGYRGQISLAQIAERVMQAASKARKQGSEDAKTKVIVKNSGKVVTSTKSGAGKVEENADAGFTIASRVSNAIKGIKN